MAEVLDKSGQLIVQIWAHTAFHGHSIQCLWNNAQTWGKGWFVFRMKFLLNHSRHPGGEFLFNSSQFSSCRYCDVTSQPLRYIMIIVSQLHSGCIVNKHHIFLFISHKNSILILSWKCLAINIIKVINLFAGHQYTMQPLVSTMHPP